MTIHAEQAKELINLMAGNWISRAIFAAAKLGIADQLTHGSCSVEVLSQKVNAHQKSLYRLMRALASVGIFEETEPSNFRLTPKSELLRSDHPASLQSLAMLWGDLEYSAWEDIVYSVKTGECAFKHRTGVPFFDFMQKNEEASQTFNLAMTSASRSIPGSLVEAYNFSEFSKMVEVGASHGALISTILRNYPKLKGVLFDLPVVAQSAREHPQIVDVASRCEIVAGNFFESVPSGGDVYILSMVIHDWDDEQSISILKNCREAIASNGKLLLVETVIEPGNGPFFGKWLDLHMLVMHGGSERTEIEYRRLLRAAGFELTRIIPTRSLRSIIEAVPL